MQIPVIKKIAETKDVYVERALPVDGSINMTQGSEVVPYDAIGECNYSHRMLNYPKGFSPYKYKEEGQFYYLGSDLGKYQSQKVTAPFNGNMSKNDDGIFTYTEVEVRYLLLSGVWGVIDKIIESKSVLIKTSMRDINLVATTKVDFAGELIVFPNPSHVLEKHYIEEFSVEAAEAKIVYVGNSVDTPLLMEAQKYGWGGVLAGSADKETFDFAKANNMCFGVFTGFGDHPTPDDVYDLLRNVANRYMFFVGEKNILRIPVPKEEAVQAPKSKFAPIKELKTGMRILALQKPYFGRLGSVDRIEGSSIFVKFDVEPKPVEIKVPNLYIAE